MISGDSAINAFRRFLDFLAKMGLSVKDDPRKVVDIAGRTWGSPVEGLVLSLALKKKEDPDELASVSVALHNTRPVPLSFVIHGWVNFFRVKVLSPDNSEAELAPYGREVFRTDHRPAATEITLAPGEALEADIPIGLIYRLKSGEYRVEAFAEVDGSRVVSNRITIQI